MLLDLGLMYLLINLCHAGGRLLVARAFGVRVDRISLGVGPTMIERVVGGTRLRVALLPLGVLVRPARPFSKKEPDSWPPPSGDRGDDRADYRSRSLAVRLAIVAGAPLAVLGLALLALVASLSVGTVGVSRTIGRVLPGSPAARAGLLPGDRLEQAAGQAISSFVDLQKVVAQSGGTSRPGLRPGELVEVVPEPRAAPIELVVRRGAETVRVTVMPEVVGGVARIGVLGREKLLPPAPPGQRVGLAIGMLGQTFSAYARQLVVPFPSRSEGRATLAGPIGVYNSLIPAGADAALRFRQLTLMAGLLAAGALATLLSPFAGYLDGAKLLFLGLEAVLRRRPHPRVEQIYNAVLLALGCAVLAAMVLLDAVR